MLRPWPSKSLNYNINFINNITKQNSNVINMMLHSSELLHKGSPYTMKLKDHHNYWLILENIFSIYSLGCTDAIISNSAN